MITHGPGSAVSITMERIATDMLYKVILPDTLCYVMHHMHFQQIIASGEVRMHSTDWQPFSCRRIHGL